ncbi:hypothetical protein M427DRAFT_36871 [Gonapodya prolifera JEL478]|uniref:Uncharacterized protein n=1 Tax=Gonapodya prolifera (strain JEL478) TaxID=1344416 RepID=A0A139A1W2_GONPJ|nr:hypothetical protein M427DRAFT_36871 [Gonapodya prolifera JEL478]|eukprot:KXS10628.1 hypothetical protein M427DRAFT_36871 [Gonapodya prolifera JEL478]
MAKGVMVLVVDAAMQVFGKLTSLISQSYFFITFWSGQLLIDILYLLYIKSFAVELRGCTRNSELNSSTPAGDCGDTPPRPGIGSPESPVKFGFPPVVTGFEPLGGVTALGRGRDGRSYSSQRMSLLVVAPRDKALDLQIWTNGVALYRQASISRSHHQNSTDLLTLPGLLERYNAVAQTLILFIFTQEWNVLPAQLKWLPLGSLVIVLASNISALLGNVYACYPFIE